MTVLTDKELGDALDDIRAVREAQERKERFEMTPQPHDFKKALEQVKQWDTNCKEVVNCYPFDSKEGIGFAQSIDVYETIIFSLRFTAKMLSEPSEGMIAAYEVDMPSGGSNYELFKAMISQAIAEIGEGK